MEFPFSIMWKNSDSNSSTSNVSRPGPEIGQKNREHFIVQLEHRKPNIWVHHGPDGDPSCGGGGAEHLDHHQGLETSQHHQTGSNKATGDFGVKKAENSLYKKENSVKWLYFKLKKIDDPQDKVQSTENTDKSNSIKINLAAYLILGIFSLRNLNFGVQVMLLIAIFFNSAHTENIIKIQAKAGRKLTLSCTADLNFPQSQDIEYVWKPIISEKNEGIKNLNDKTLNIQVQNKS